MMTDREVFQTNLYNLMKKSNVKQADIARYAEVSYKTVSAWVCGRGYPRVEAMEKLCRFFGVKQSALTEKPDETDEDRLLIAFRLLSNEGKTKLLERAEELKQLYPIKKRRKIENEKE